MLNPPAFSPPLLPHIPGAPSPAWHFERKAIKYPRITIKADLGIFVRVPLHFKQVEVDRFVGGHYEWITSTLEKLAARSSSLHALAQAHEREILLFGTWRRLEELEGADSRHALDSTLESSAESATPHLDSDTESDTQSTTQSRLKSRAPKNPKATLKALLLDYIAPRTQELSRQMELPYTALKITNATSRFGSCTYDNRLFFSLMLGFARKELIDYVIIHELAHIRHKNHSPAFWQLVERHCKDSKALRATLRQEARIYPLLLQRL